MTTTKAPVARTRKPRSTGGAQGSEAPRHWLRVLVGQLHIQTKDRGTVRIDEIINSSQEDLLAECCRQLDEDGQIRAIVLKARQMGMSTIIEAVIFILAMVLDYIEALIVSHENDSAQGILNMTKRYWASYPYAQFHDNKFNGRKQLSWSDIGSQVQIATAKNVDAGRSKTIHLLHASEVAFWPDPETLMKSLRNAIPGHGVTAIFLESTANGMGNYFHTMVTKAMRGENEFVLKFYPWFEFPEYTAAYLKKSDRAKYTIDNLDEEEKEIVRLYGVDHARLAWRRYAIENLCNGSIDAFHQEYPCSLLEAFVSTGRNVFPFKRLIAHYDPRRGQRGILRRSRTGKIEFMPHEDGWLTVFVMPSIDRQWGVYVVGGDPTHTTAGDNACAQVLNRRTLEQCAVYRRKIDPINFGKHMQLLGAWYHNALLAPEKEGPGYATVGCIVGDNYPNVYQAQDVAKTPGHPVGDLYGWSTNSKTKHLAVSTLLKLIIDPVVGVLGDGYGLVIHDEQTMMELRDYVTKDDGSGYTNGDGSDYDDGVMALAIACTVDNIEPQPMAYVEGDPAEQFAKPSRRPIAAPVASGPVITSSHGPEEEVLELDAPDDSEDIAPPWEAWGVPKDTN